MKGYLILMIMTFSQTLFAYHISVESHERFDSNGVVVNFDTDECESIDLSKDDIRRQFHQSFKQYWGKVKTSLKLNLGKEIDTDIEYAYTAKEALEYVEINTILVACNTEHYQFIFNPGLGMRSGLECSENSCKGVILVNANKDSMVKDYDDRQFQGYFAHEFGKMIGLGNIIDPKSIMYPYIFRLYPLQLSADDKQGFEFLYPVK